MSEEERDFEERVRELLAEDAYTIRPSTVPYPEIRRRGTVERRRRVAAAGAVLVTLAALPVGAYAVSGGGSGGSGVADAPTASVSATRSPKPTPTAPAGPARPATDGQLLDGITFERAAEAVDQCLAYNAQFTHGPEEMDQDLGPASSYRIILAMKSTGDSNAPGDGMYVVAVKKDDPAGIRMICNIRDGEAQGLNIGGADAYPGAPAVLADMNGGKLYQQSVLDRGHWKLPFRWGVIGTFKPSVAKVTVEYGGETSQAVLDHGWFVASGVLDHQVIMAPRIKGYDAGGKLVYDSDEDGSYQKTLP
ncbi:hypothetical protein Stsp02_14160 [Streptomyces sp. NBRC 14336]|uniref:hypothetical protein n=1 Tax=Streptomyces sp. NBRC 14336 TaxID=3030992 RepID=UPI0024A385B9|nr:hypothetical protein [Streptomyces sp. NBRC 14336]WBO77892.1 hypothetical protein SBE_001449 [Streptomyces sp. SBE_14.2]GLW45754.1 hypothetical protein Stsp02_14160 [Streptomyces sp. NBRC 14336]